MGVAMNQRELEKLYRELQERKAKGIYKTKRSTSSSSAISQISQVTAVSTTSSRNRYTPWHDRRLVPLAATAAAAVVAVSSAAAACDARHTHVTRLGAGCHRSSLY